MRYTTRPSRMAKQTKLQATVEYLVARTLVSGFGLLPRSCALALGIGLGQAGYRVFGKLRRVGEINLRIAFPELTERERRRLLRASFISLGRLLAEFSQFPTQTPEKLRQLIEYDPVGHAHLRQAETEGRGVIFLTGHLGSWELLSFGWSALEYPISFLVRPMDNSLIEEMIHKV